jgi:hypothetical protein
MLFERHLCVVDVPDSDEDFYIEDGVDKYIKPHFSQIAKVS